MTQRTWAALLAVPLFVALGLYTAVTGLPYVTYAPGPTINVLGDNGEQPIIDVQGHRTYRDDGELRMTTVSVTQRNAKLDLFTLMRTWFSKDDAVYPFSARLRLDGQPAAGHAGGPGRDGHLAGLRDGGGAEAAGLPRSTPRSRSSASPPRCRPTASSRCATSSAASVDTGHAAHRRRQADRRRTRRVVGTDGRSSATASRSRCG